MGGAHEKFLSICLVRFIREQEQLYKSQSLTKTSWRDRAALVLNNHGSPGQ